VTECEDNFDQGNPQSASGAEEQK